MNYVKRTFHKKVLQMHACCQHALNNFFAKNIFAVSFNSRNSQKYFVTKAFSCMVNTQWSPPLQVWNHPWVLKLDEDRKFEREERKRLYDSDDDSLGGFIVSGSCLESEEEESVSRKKKKNDMPSLVSRQNDLAHFSL